MGNEIHILLNGQQNIVAVFFGDGRQIDMHTRHILTLACPQFAIVLHLCYHSRTIDADDLHVNGSVIKQNMVVYMYIIGEVFVAQVYDVMCCIHTRTTENLHHITRFVSDGRIT